MASGRSLRAEGRVFSLFGLRLLALGPREHHRIRVDIPEMRFDSAIRLYDEVAVRTRSVHHVTLLKSFDRSDRVIDIR